MATFEDSKRRLFSEDLVRSPLLNHTLDLDCAKVARVVVSESRRTDNVLVLAEFYRFHQIFFVFLGESTERGRHLTNPGDDDPNAPTVLF